MNEHLERLEAALADRYTIERELGQGGMATVYEAKDLKHQRTVALKVLKPELAAVLGTDRFLREIGVAARLNHPHILPLLDSGAADGTLYFTMPLVTGPSLAQRIRHEGPLGLDEIRALVTDVASALDYAHAQGIVHRDLKPDNILLHHGKPMIADFGIALAVSHVGGERLTETGLSIGTPQYMSPEQVSGERTLDARSDVYALGCVVYEMVVGDPPFTGRTAQAVMARQVTDPVPPIRTVRRDVPASVEAAVTKALAKVPGDRFASVGEFATALAASDVAEPKAQAAPATATTDRPTIAVLPFANVGQDPENEYFAEGVWEDVLANLSRVDGLRAISRTSCLQFKDTSKSMRQVGEELGAGMILEGSVRRAADRVRVVVQLVDAQADEQRWAETYDRELTDIFAIQSEVALSVATALRTALTPGERERLKQRPTDDLAAYDLYLLGRHHLNKRTDEDIRQAIGHFESALALDPRFVSAHAGLAEAYLFVGMGYAAMPPKEALPRAREAAARAIELDPNSAEAHATHGFVRLLCDWDAAGALAELQQAVELNPDRPEPHQWLAWCQVMHGEIAAGLESWQRALEVDPLSAVVVNENGWPYSYVGLDEQALVWYRRAIKMEPVLALAHFNAGWALHRLGRLDEAISAYERGVELSGGAPFMRAFLATALVDAGRPEEARRILDDLTARATHAHGLSLSIAMAAEALGDKVLALNRLDRALEERDPFLSTLGLDDAWITFPSLRDHPRYCALLDRIGIGRSLPSDYRARERAKILARMRSTPASGARGPGAAEVAEPEHDVKSIVVLPFANLSPDPENEYFSDGLTEEIIADLSKLQSLRVISRNSAMQLKGTDKNTKTIGRELNVQYVLEGTVRKAGDRLRITAQLIDAGNDAHLWAEKYNGVLQDVFDMQEQLSGSIVQALELRLSPDEDHRLGERRFEDVMAYECVLQARRDMWLLSGEALDRALDHVERGLTIVGDNGELYAMKGVIYMQYVNTMSRPPNKYEGLLKRAQQCVTRALSINPSSSAAQFAQGMVFHQSGNPKGAIRHWGNAADLDPNDADATAMLAFQLTAAGVNLERARRLAERAAVLDPLKPMNKGALGWIHSFNCDFSTALEGWRDWQQVLEQAKSTFRLWFAFLHAADGNLDEAFRIFDQMAQDSPGHPMADGGSFLKHALSGDRERTLGAVTVQLEQAAWWDDGYSLFMACGYALIGELDRAFPWLDHSIDYGFCNPYFLEHEPLIENLRSDARFKASLERAKRLSESLLEETS